MYPLDNAIASMEPKTVSILPHLVQADVVSAISKLSAKPTDDMLVWDNFRDLFGPDAWKDVIDTGARPSSDLTTLRTSLVQILGHYMLEQPIPMATLVQAVAACPFTSRSKLELDSSLQQQLDHMGDLVSAFQNYKTLGIASYATSAKSIVNRSKLSDAEKARLLQAVPRLFTSDHQKQPTMLLNLLKNLSCSSSEIRTVLTHLCCSFCTQLTCQSPPESKHFTSIRLY